MKNLRIFVALWVALAALSIYGHAAPALDGLTPALGSSASEIKKDGDLELGELYKRGTRSVAVTTPVSVNAVVLTSSNVPATALVDGITVEGVANSTNTGATTVALDGLAATTLRDMDGNALVGGEVVAGRQFRWRYHFASTQWRIVAGNSPFTSIAGVGSAVNIPLSAGTNGLGLTNSSFAINYAPSGFSGSEALQVYRTDTWTGGTPGNTTAAIRSYMTNPSGRLAYSWTNVAVMNNNGTIGDGSESTATYAYAAKNSTGKTWAATAQVIDTTGNADPTGQTVAQEFDVEADGTDANANRVAVDAHFLSHTGAVNSYGTAAFKASTDSAKSFWIYGLDCHTANISSACIAMKDAQAIDFGADIGGRTLTHNSTQWQFNNNSLGTQPLIITDVGNGTFLGSLQAGSINNTPIGSTTRSTLAATTGNFTGQITSSLGTGTAPLSVASTTNVANLNASSLNGATFASPGAIGGGTPGAITGTTITANTQFSGPHNGTVGAITPSTGAFTTITASGQFTSTLATGTAPFAVSSTTLVSNLYVARSALADAVTTNANLTGVITSSGNATSIASQTGTGTKFVVDTSPTLVTPILGTFTGTKGTLTNSAGASGPMGISTTVTQTGPNAGDTGDSAAYLGYTLSAASATNELVGRVFQLAATNNLTSGGHLQALRGINVNLITNSGAITDTQAGLYIEGSNAGTVTTAYGVYVSNAMPGTTKYGFYDQGQNNEFFGATQVTTLSTTSPATKTGTSYTVAATDFSLIINASGTFTLTLPAAASFPGRIINVKSISAQIVKSASSNVAPIGSATAGTAIFTASSGKFVSLQSDGANWISMAAN